MMRCPVAKAARVRKTGNKMGLVNTKVILKNPKEREIQPLEVEALADSGAVHLCIPEHVKIQLKLEEIDKRKSL
jgi:hypothetical protein